MVMICLSGLVLSATAGWPTRGLKTTSTLARSISSLRDSPPNYSRYRYRIYYYLFNSAIDQSTAWDIAPQLIINIYFRFFLIAYRLIIDSLQYFPRIVNTPRYRLINPCEFPRNYHRFVYFYLKKNPIYQLNFELKIRSDIRPHRISGFWVSRISGASLLTIVLILHKTFGGFISWLVAPRLVHKLHRPPLCLPDCTNNTGTWIIWGLIKKETQTIIALTSRCRSRRPVSGGPSHRTSALSMKILKYVSDEKNHM
jgi:hypothetical protein